MLSDRTMSLFHLLASVWGVSKIYISNLSHDTYFWNVCLLGWCFVFFDFLIYPLKSGRKNCCKGEVRHCFWDCTIGIARSRTNPSIACSSHNVVSSIVQILKKNCRKKEFLTSEPRMFCHIFIIKCCKICQICDSCQCWVLHLHLIQQQTVALGTLVWDCVGA